MSEDRNESGSDEQSSYHLPIFEGPMCIIETNKDGLFEVKEDVLAQIQKIDAPLVVVAIAGPYRTGKSYLMNRLAGSTKGFPLGNTIHSKTKGIWAWCKVHPEKKNTVLLLLDTEGLGDVKKGDIQHDNKIITLATLLCNVLVYNLFSVLGQETVEKLTFVTEISKLIRFKLVQGEAGDDKQLGFILPSFVLCLRDFTVKLEDENGKPITADEYLEDCLQPKPGSDETVITYNRPRECLTKYFQKRNCFVFDSPGGRTLMSRLENAEEHELSESFLEDSKAFLQFIYQEDPKVLFGAKPVNGPMFVSLATTYVDAIKRGAVPDVNDAVKVVANIENQRNANAAVEEYKTKIEPIRRSLPELRKGALAARCQDVQRDVLNTLRKRAMFDWDKFEAQILNDMTPITNELHQQNRKLVNEHCKRLLLQLFGGLMQRKLHEGTYKCAGGYSEYRNDIDQLKRAYKYGTREMSRHGPEKVWNRFVEEQDKPERDIMMADKQLNEIEKKEEIERLHADHSRAQKEQAERLKEEINEEKGMAEQYYNILQNERLEMKRELEKKSEEVIKEYQLRVDISEKKMKMMRTENDSLKKKLQAEVDEQLEQYRNRYEEQSDQLKEARQEAERYRQQLDEEREKGPLDKIADKLSEWMN